MAIDPSADPWGTAMLGAAALGTLALLTVVAARLGGRRPGLRGWLLALCLLGFLGSSVAGAVDRIKHPSVAEDEASRSGAEPAQDLVPERDDTTLDPENGAEAGGQTGPLPTEDPDAGSTPPPGDVAAANQDDGEGGSESGDEDLAEEETTVVPASPKPNQAPVPPPPSQARSDLDPLPALPSEDAELRTLARLALREGKRVASSERECKELAPLGNAWARIAQLPTDVYRARVEVIARRLETCRRKATWARNYAIHRDRVKARDAFRDVYRKRLAATDVRVSTAVSGAEHERLRVGGRELTPEQVEELVDTALENELAALGFEKVTFSNGKKSWTTVISRVTDATLVTAELARYRLDEPLALAE